MPRATVDDEVIMEPILTEPNRKNSGASESLKSTFLSVEHKNYCIFVAPNEVSECMELCRNYIGHGSTVCCKKNH